MGCGCQKGNRVNDPLARRLAAYRCLTCRESFTVTERAGAVAHRDANPDHVVAGLGARKVRKVSYVDPTVEAAADAALHR